MYWTVALRDAATGPVGQENHQLTKFVSTHSAKFRYNFMHSCGFPPEITLVWFLKTLVSNNF